jgi:Flp pilus assembly protein TadD
VNEAFDDLERAEALRPKDATVLFYKTSAAARLGKLSQTIENLTKLIELDASNAPAFTERGHSLMQQGRVEAAKADFERALSLDPDSARARSGLDRLGR